MSANRVTTLAGAISTYVQPGMTVALEGFGHLVPMAAAHEIIRQRIGDLTICRMSCDMMIDQLIAAGCVSGLVSSFIGNSSGGSLHELRRALEGRSDRVVTLDEYSHGGMIARYVAGAAKLPFYPIRSYDGSDLATVNDSIRQVIDPYSGDAVSVVPPLNPDVSIIHAQRADRRGNVQAWGILGVQQDVAFAGRRVIVTVEEIVDDDVVRADPNRTIVPSQIVDAVVECPFGSYPAPVQGYYDRDDAFFRAWSEMGRAEDGVDRWLDTFVRGTADHAEYMGLVGPEVRGKLQVGQALSGRVNYGLHLRPGTAGPDPAGDEAAGPDPAGDEAAGSDATGPGPAGDGAARDDSTEGEAARPDPARPGVDQEASR
jgi:glutaconate CoA-transferase subunit A